MTSSAEIMDKLAKLEGRRLELEAEIAEAKARLPAHSVKPAQMVPLLELEDEYEALFNCIQVLKRDSDKGD